MVKVIPGHIPGGVPVKAYRDIQACCFFSCHFILFHLQPFPFFRFKSACMNIALFTRRSCAPGFPAENMQRLYPDSNISQNQKICKIIGMISKDFAYLLLYDKHDKEE